jgi:LmbE family N-acetylglucosaminyl deacetylase
MRIFTPAQPALFVSTHLDDVGLSCSHYLTDHPGTKVVTVMTGAPEIHRKDDWNSWTTGESYAPDALRVRRAEDAAVMRRLRAEPLWLAFWDDQYLEGRDRDVPGIARAFADLVTRHGAASIVGPLGLRHPDHIAVSLACLDAARRLDLELYYYLDMPYAQKGPGDMQERLAALAADGVELEALEPVKPRRNAKKRVVKLYKTQCDKMDYANMREVMRAPERFWQVMFARTLRPTDEATRRLAAT